MRRDRAPRRPGQLLVRSIAFVLALAPVRVSAQAPDREPGSELTVYLATMDQGDLVYEKFGHNAIWIHDALTRSTIAYNYGIFDLRQENFILRFVQGRMLYQMGVDDAARQLADYEATNRSVTLQRLNLTAAQKHALREFLEWNWRPANREYLYDYFLDNCSTRVRDALDRALGGALSAALRGRPTGTSFSSHSLRLTAATPATYTGLMLAFGLPASRPIDAWEESFVPMVLMEHVRSIQVPDADGAMVPLVAEESVAFQADREPAPDAAPGRTVLYLAIGLLIAGALLLLARAGRAGLATRAAPAGPAARAGGTGRFARALLAFAIFFWGIATGFLGLILALLWLFTDHAAAYPNLNLLQVSPLALILAAAGPFAVVGGTSRFARLAWPAAVALAAMSLCGLLLSAVPDLRQLNGPLIALLLPIHVAAAAAVYLSQDARPSHVEDGTGRTAAPAAE
jgi:hypothetical protein